jgi:hypothetical protein
MRRTEIPTSVIPGIMWRLMGCFTFQSFYHFRDCVLVRWEVEWSLEHEWIWWNGKVGDPAWNRAAVINRSLLTLTFPYRVTPARTRSMYDLCVPYSRYLSLVTVAAGSRNVCFMCVRVEHNVFINIVFVLSKILCLKVISFLWKQFLTLMLVFNITSFKPGCVKRGQYTFTISPSIPARSYTNRTYGN